MQPSYPIERSSQSTTAFFKHLINKALFRSASGSRDISGVKPKSKRSVNRARGKVNQIRTSPRSCSREVRVRVPCYLF